ncbi:MAG: hypothetical protein ACI8XO_005076 [Verrucomicrobiales bacterium]|jgi:hypothetical protein
MGLTHRNAGLRFGLTMTLTLAGGIFLADARLGETRGELTATDGRYGAPIGQSTPALKDSLEKVDTFEKDKINITTEYDRDGKVWRITYKRKDLRHEIMENLLEKNGGERKWSEFVKYRENKHWITDDKKLHAVYYGNPVYRLIIMTDAAARAERVAATLEDRSTTRISESKEADGEKGDPTDPLDGF